MDKDIKIDKIFRSFTGKPSKKGPQYYFSIPIAYIKDKHIDPNKRYRIYLEELKEE